jgi:heat-inducible transcriptional repressor
VHARLKHLELVSLHDFSALLVMVLQDVKVRQQVLTLREPSTQDDLTRLARRLNQLLGGLTGQQLKAKIVDLSPLEEQIALVAAEIVHAEDVVEFPDPHLDGVRNVLSQPEFARSERMLDILDALDERNIGKTLPPAEVAEDNVVVFIGAENREDVLKNCSIVLGRYGGLDGPSGTIAVVGPTRLHYARAFATIRYVGALISELMVKLYE